VIQVIQICCEALLHKDFCWITRWITWITHGKIGSLLRGECSLKWLDFVIFCLAAYRVTHFIVFDKLFEPVRGLFVKRKFETIPYGDGKQVKVVFFTLQGGELRRVIGSIINCFWCAGIWVSLLMITAYLWFTPFMFWVYAALAAAAALSLIETAWAKVVGFPEMVERK
jgi:hypothetical protein